MIAACKLHVSEPLRIKYHYADIAAAMMASDADQISAISERIMHRAAPSLTDLSDASTRLTLLSFLCARSGEIALSRLVPYEHTCIR